MPSRMLAAKAIDESLIRMQFDQDKRSTTLNQSSELSKEKPKLPSRIKNVDLLQKVGALKTEKLPRQPSKDREEVKKSFVASPLGTPYKLWPSRQLKGFDDPVMNMSNVPLYLQCKGKGDNVHGRALNVGVLDWGLLEKWTHHQKDVGVRDSASSSIESSSFSDFSNQSCRTISSPISQGKKSPAIPCKKSPVSSSPTKICENDDTKHVKGFHDLSISSKMLPTRHEDHLDADFCASADRLGCKRDKFIGTALDVKTSSNQEHLAQHSITSFPMHEIDEATPTRVVEDHSCSLMKEAEATDRDNILPLTSNMPFFMYCNKGMWDYLQGGVGSECLNSDLAEDFEVISHYPQISHSCPLPLAVLDDESDVASNHPSFGVAPTDESVCMNGKQHEINTTTLESRESEAKTKASGGKQSFVRPSNAGPKMMSKSSSSRESSTEQQYESVPLSYNSRGDQATRNNKSRQSPLRRILDPIMKPKNNLHLTGINAALNNQHSGELQIEKPPYGLHKPSNPKLNSTRQAREAMFTSNELPNDKGTQNEDRHAAQMKQALLQLAWKNGLPLFMFSSCDDEVLAAAVTMGSTCNDDDLECVYRIFSVNGSQKKSTFWSNGANKGKKHHLVSNVVGQLNVSLAKLKSYGYGSSDGRAFVLHDACKSVDSSIASELAAIVVGITPPTKSDSSPVLNNSNYRGPLSTYSAANVSVSKNEEHLQIYQQNNGIEQTGISVIIPSRAHGLSIEGQPSTLIERWRSGACDCGGWDEGCPLSILRNKIQGSQTDDTHRFQLFTQGASEENRHAFSMVSFKEGFYTVGFQSPVSFLQAFAICIAILHDKKPNNHLSQRRSLRAHIYNDQLARTQGVDPLSYVPNHPPLSPFGRA